MTFDPTSVEVTCVTLPKDHFIQVPWKYVKVCGYSDLFSKTWTKGHGPPDDLWPQVCWGHLCDATQCPCVQVPWEYINVCGYSDQFYKIAHTYMTHHIKTGQLSVEYISRYYSICMEKKKKKILRLIFDHKIAMLHPIYTRVVSSLSK